MSILQNLQFGITQQFQCNYLPEKQERLIIAMSDEANSTPVYSLLMNQGFRRSGKQIYRPHCEFCRACHSIRIPVAQFKPSKSQKRNAKRNLDISFKFTEVESNNYYRLYESYINQVHSDGLMFPANRQQYESFIFNSNLNVKFIEFYLESELCGVAVIDVLDDAFSAVYTFYDPSLSKRGIGVHAILTQINLAKSLGLKYLYLGYQIDKCSKMNYKTRFKPYEILQDNTWNLVNI